MSWDLDLNPMQFQWGNRLQGLRQEFRFSGEIVGHHHVTCSVAIIKSNFICFSELSRVVPWLLNQAAIMPKVPYDKIRWSHDDISAKSLPGSSWLLLPGTHSTIIRASVHSSRHSPAKMTSLPFRFRLHHSMSSLKTMNAGLPYFSLKHFHWTMSCRPVDSTVAVSPEMIHCPGEKGRICQFGLTVAPHQISLVVGPAHVNGHDDGAVASGPHLLELGVDRPPQFGPPPKFSDQLIALFENRVPVRLGDVTRVACSRTKISQRFFW